MAIHRKEIPDSANARFGLLKIPPLSPADDERASTLLSQASNETLPPTDVVDFCQSNRKKIEALWKLGSELSLSEQDAYSEIIPCAGFIRLLVLDSASRQQAGDEDGSMPPINSLGFQNKTQHS